MITIKNPQEIEIMAEGGQILARVMKKLIEIVEPGISTEKLNKAAESLVLKYGGECSFKNYQDIDDKSAEPFPACLCTSINKEIVHGVPSGRILKNGDILSLDLGVFYKGFHTDMAVTVPIGKVDSEVLRLIRVTKKALKRGIKKIRPGNTIGDVENTVERYIKSQNFNIIKDLCGHGIGRELHEDPQILNYGKRHKGEKIRKGMVFCLEPMVVIGNWKIEKSKNSSTYVSQSGSLSAHFEHTIAVTENGCKILTILE